MPHLAVAAVEVLRVHAVEVPHQARQIGLPRAQHEVVVVAHQAIGEHLGVEALHGPPHDLQQTLAIAVVGEDRLAPVAARSDVVDGTLELDAKRACHGASVRTRGAKGKT